MGENREGKVHQGTCIKDTWTKPKGVGSRLGGRMGGAGVHGGVKMEKWKQLYLNNNKEEREREREREVNNEQGIQVHGRCS